MGIFVRAIVTGFGFSLGKALFDRVSSQFGFEKAGETTPDPTGDDTDDDDQLEDSAG
jgi:hypothetical protein